MPSVVSSVSESLGVDAIVPSGVSSVSESLGVDAIVPSVVSSVVESLGVAIVPSVVESLGDAIVPSGVDAIVPTSVPSVVSSVVESLGVAIVPTSGSGGHCLKTRHSMTRHPTSRPYTGPLIRTIYHNCLTMVYFSKKSQNHYIEK